MIQRLEIENFYSIRETQVIDLRIGAKVPDEEGRFGEIHDGSGERVPKTVAFFGANASGKSNVLRALAFLKWFIADSFQLVPGDEFPLWRFADGNTDPVRIKVEFDRLPVSAKEDELYLGEPNPARFVYEARFAGAGGKPLSVLSEEFRLQPVSGKSRRIFERNENGEVRSSPGFPLKGFSQVLAKLRGNVSLTSTITQFAEHEPAAALVWWAKNIGPNFFTASVDPFERKVEIPDESVFKFYKDTPRLVDALNGILGRVDLGIRSMSFAKMAFVGPVPQFQHEGLEQPIQFHFESEGTRQFLRVYPLIWDALLYGGIAVLDELDSTIHPAFLPEILRWFQDPEENPNNAQLWMSGHSASLLEDLCKEEIFFAEKDQQGRTRVYGLKDIEGVRRVDNFYQKYLGGVYGAVPRIG
ncbi:MAG: AAA family ATPase [Terracidiphilus sp.]|nr:AAA family ATPase [Terracidiphilus sp.]MDR3797570.1 AAA family ATPase [Terracidiphilus sp.]